jgi:SAM-dependent methyltransferase
VPDPYEQLARYYDLALSGFGDDLALYGELARAAGGPVLELGAGTGRVANALARAGCDIIALDQAAAMLTAARTARPRRVNKTPALVCGDMRRPPLRGAFGLILCARDTFLHLADASEQIATLAAARALLAPNGRLVLDLPGPASDLADWEPGARPLVLDWSREQGNTRISRFVTFTANLATQTQAVTEVYEEVDAEGGVRRRFVEYLLRHVFPAELDLLLAAAGLRTADRYGGYGLEPFDAASERLIAVAERVDS